MSVWLPRQSLPSSLVSRRVLARHVHPRLITVYHLQPSSRNGAQYPVAQRFFSNSQPYQNQENPRNASSSSPSNPIHSQPHDGPTAEPKNPIPASPPPHKEVSTVQAPLATRVWKKVKHEVQHYWHGSKLLVSEVRISARLQWKLLHGESLTRRERRQVCQLLLRLIRNDMLNSLDTSIVETYNTRLATTHTFRCLCHCAVHGTIASRRSQIIPEYASFNLRGQICCCKRILFVSHDQ